MDPFFAETTLVLVCDTLEPLTGEPYNRDPRSICNKAAGLVKSMGVGDTVFFGPEAEFFIFDDGVRQMRSYSLQHGLSCRGHSLRTHPASGRVRNVLFGLSLVASILPALP
jgi:glutamine synthetase